MQQQFVGLTMPVFTAFGWAGEEQALKFALSQLEQFIASLHAALPRRVQTHLPFFGLNPETQVVYLAANQNVEEDVYLSFIARPMSMELQLALTDKMAIGRALKAIEGDPERGLKILQELDDEWTLHIKQMEVDESNGDRASYQDLYKDNVSAMDLENAQSVASRANFLNGEPQWVTPLYLSRRFPSEQIAAMGTDVVRVMSDQLRELVPLLDFLTGRLPQPVATKKGRVRAKPKATAAPRQPDSMDPERQFVYATQLKPLHIRRGFINLTPEHWPFFAESARATTREVTVRYDDKVDKGSSVWHLAANDIARVVLSEPVRIWLQEMFDADDTIQVTATKLANDVIEITLELVE